MYTDMEQRARELGEWIVENRATVRAAAARFGVSKSTVHKDMTERLRRIDRLLYEKVRLVLEPPGPAGSRETLPGKNGLPPSAEVRFSDTGPCGPTVLLSSDR